MGKSFSRIARRIAHHTAVTIAFALSTQILAFAQPKTSSDQFSIADHIDIMKCLAKAAGVTEFIGDANLSNIDEPDGVQVQTVYFFGKTSTGEHVMGAMSNNFLYVPGDPIVRGVSIMYDEDRPPSRKVWLSFDGPVTAPSGIYAQIFPLPSKYTTLNLRKAMVLQARQCWHQNLAPLLSPVVPTGPMPTASPISPTLPNATTSPTSPTTTSSPASPVPTNHFMI